MPLLRLRAFVSCYRVTFTFALPNCLDLSWNTPRHIFHGERATYPVVKRPVRAADQSPPPGDEVMNDAVLHRDYYTFHFIF
jgi:hypothetical protein